MVHPTASGAGGAAVSVEVADDAHASVSMSGDDFVYDEEPPAPSPHPSLSNGSASSPDLHCQCGDDVKVYLGVRRDRQGNLVRRHFSRARFPHLATKAAHHSSHMPSGGRRTNNLRRRGRCPERCGVDDNSDDRSQQFSSPWSPTERKNLADMSEVPQGASPPDEWEAVRNDVKKRPDPPADSYDFDSTQANKEVANQSAYSFDFYSVPNNDELADPPALTADSNSMPNDDDFEDPPAYSTSFDSTVRSDQFNKPQSTRKKYTLAFEDEFDNISVGKDSMGEYNHPNGSIDKSQVPASTAPINNIISGANQKESPVATSTLNRLFSKVKIKEPIEDELDTNNDELALKNNDLGEVSRANGDIKLPTKQPSPKSTTLSENTNELLVKDSVPGGVLPAMPANSTRERRSVFFSINSTTGKSKESSLPMKDEVQEYNPDDFISQSPKVVNISTRPKSKRLKSKVVLIFDDEPEEGEHNDDSRNDIKRQPPHSYIPSTAFQSVSSVLSGKEANKTAATTATFGHSANKSGDELGLRLSKLQDIKVESDVPPNSDAEEADNMGHPRQPRFMTYENQERIRRFQEAYNAIMLATNMKGADDEMSVSTEWLNAGRKRWTRDPNASPAISIDGRMYDDLQRTPTVSLKQINKSYVMDTSKLELSDRGASWLVHVPTPWKTKLDGVTEESNAKDDTPDRRTKKGPSSCQQRLIHGIERGLNEAISRASPSPLENNPGQSESGNDVPNEMQMTESDGLCRSETERDVPGEVGRSSEKCNSNSKDLNIDTTPAVGTRTLRRLFAGMAKAPHNFQPATSKQSEEVHAALTNEKKRQDCSSSKISPKAKLGEIRSIEIDESMDKALESLRLKLVNNPVPSIIDTDGTESDIDVIDVAAKTESLFLSPSLLTKRYHQALHVIELRSWDQLSYLINANPWLLEMNDVRNDQSLVHALAFFGGQHHNIGGDSAFVNAKPLPKQLVRIIVNYIPDVVHKLDTEGNLPLHMAAASGNIAMIRELGGRFPAGASVQNHSGLLPLHLAVMSCSLFVEGLQAVQLILAMFPTAIRVKDVDGNTPLHIAAGTLREEIGVYVINQLVNASEATVDHYLVKNNQGETPLAKAIISSAGLEVAEALLLSESGKLAVLANNFTSQNALHLALGVESYNPAVVLLLLKSAPASVTMVDGQGRLPIQLACLNSAQREIILAIAFVDLPIDLGANDDVIFRNGFGASWWYLLCESDDLYVSVVKEILSLCSYPQRVALSEAQAGNSPLASATPQCKLALRNSVFLLGRFELERGAKLSASSLQKLNAIDLGTHESPIPAGANVTLFCYTDASLYNIHAGHLENTALGADLFEEVSHFKIGHTEASLPRGFSCEYCVSTNLPDLSLTSVVSEMKCEYRLDETTLGQYYGRVKNILRQTAKALHRLHKNNIIHGQLDCDHIGKFGSRWKLTGLTGSAINGNAFAINRLGLHSPPEACTLMYGKTAKEYSIGSISPVKAEPTVDIWSFGKLMYEVLVRESLFVALSGQHASKHVCEHILLTWDGDHLKKLSDKLAGERIGSSGVQLVSCCLSSTKSGRFQSMLDILDHPFWKDKRAFNLHGIK